MKNYLIKRQSRRRNQAMQKIEAWYRDTALMGALFSGGTGSFALIAGDSHLVNRSSEDLAR
jgi:hypothetical protein